MNRATDDAPSQAYDATQGANHATTELDKQLPKALSLHLGLLCCCLDKLRSIMRHLLSDLSAAVTAKKSVTLCKHVAAAKHRDAKTEVAGIAVGATGRIAASAIGSWVSATCTSAHAFLLSLAHGKRGFEKLGTKSCNEAQAASLNGSAKTDESCEP